MTKYRGEIHHRYGKFGCNRMSRAVVQFDKVSGHPIAVYVSMGLALKMLFPDDFRYRSLGSMSSNLRGKSKSAHGFVWTFEDQIEDKTILEGVKRYDS